jgi:hypothetical protein
MRPHTSAEREIIISHIKESVNRTIPYQYWDDYARMLIAREHFFSADTNDIGSTVPTVPTVPYQYWDNYARMLIAREHFFSADTNDIGSSNLLEHQIDLMTTDPIYCPQFRLPAEHLKHIQENVAGWLQRGIIERSKSNYNSPIFGVPKNDGQGICTVLDYRMLNSRLLLSLYSVRTHSLSMNASRSSAEQTVKCSPPRTSATPFGHCLPERLIAPTRPSPFLGLDSSNGVGWHKGRQLPRIFLQAYGPNHGRCRERSHLY